MKKLYIAKEYLIYIVYSITMMILVLINIIANLLVYKGKNLYQQIFKKYKDLRNH